MTATNNDAAENDYNDDMATDPTTNSGFDSDETEALQEELTQRGSL